MKILTATALLFAIALPATAQAIPNSDSNLTNYQQKPLVGHSLGQEAMNRSRRPMITPARIDRVKITPLPRITIDRPVYRR